MGLDLSDPDEFLYIGASAEVNPYKITGLARVLWLSTHGTSYLVFLQLWDRTQPVVLNPAEVAAYRWVSFDVFTHKFQQFFQPKTSQISSQSKHPALSIRLAALLLPLQPAVNPAVASGHQPDLSSEFILWGITFRVPGI